MPRNSPPKHRHDGTSPLPLSMDWSPPPKKWDGRNTIWPHNPHTGWSYCVIIPSWKIQTGSGTSSDSFLNPTVFYRIHVGIQSPEGLSTSHGVLRRFSDFLKLFSALKKAFPKKDVPSPPPKHALLRINSSRQLLEQRRHALEEWMGKMLSHIDLSRSAPVAAFLELEAAARSACQDLNQQSLETSSSRDAFVRPSPGAYDHDGSTVASISNSVTSDVGSDSAYETSDLGTPRQGKDHITEFSREILASGDGQVGAFDNDIVLGEFVLDQPEESLRSMIRGDIYRGSLSKEFHSRDSVESSEQGHEKLSVHARKSSSGSVGSDVSSLRCSELSLPGMTSSIVDGSTDLAADADTPNALQEMQHVNDAHIVLPLDQRNKLNRVLVTMQRRLVTAKTDMEDLIARLNQEMTVKEYLTTKVKDLEVELEVTKQKNKENLQQAILIERERVTQMQWDVDEFRRKYVEMESMLKLEQSETIRVESEMATLCKRVQVGERQRLILRTLVNLRRTALGMNIHITLASTLAGMTRDDLFNINAGIVKGLCAAIAKYCSNALVNMISNPVNSTVPIAAEVFKKAGTYDKKKLFGLAMLDVVRAKTFYAGKVNVPVADVNVSVVGGHAGVTILPLFSQATPSYNDLSDNLIKALTKRTQDSGTKVVEAKVGKDLPPCLGPMLVPSLQIYV